MPSKLIYGLSVLQVYLIGLVLIQYNAMQLTFVECAVGLDWSINFDACLSVLPLGLH